MHPRNPYRTPPDFVKLATAYPLLKPHLVAIPGGATIDFKNHAAQRCLTQALLYRDFDLVLAIPQDRLCPPVPNRLNYVLWLQDIIDITLLADSSQSQTKRVRGIDIGTGASAIYPLLGCRSKDTWTFTATDIDETSLQYAKTNIARNDLETRITLVKSQLDGPILMRLFDEVSLASAPHQQESVYDFVMCNPPFYSSKEEISQSAEAKELGPNSVCTGADVEMIAPGGEAAFVCKMVRESAALTTHCRWYTSMLGKLSSLTEVVALLRSQHIDNYAVTEFVQGQTRRWAIAWSYGDIRLPDTLARISNPSLQSLMPSRNTLRHSFPQAQTLPELLEIFTSVLASIDDIRVSPLNTSIPHDSAVFLVTLTRNTWSRAARRKKNLGTPVVSPTPAKEANLIVSKISIELHSGPPASAVRFDWIRGTDKERPLWESFVSHVERKVKSALESRTEREDVDVAMS